MTPTPPSGSNPLIHRIADALGVFHLVAPVDHHHSQAEIDGLVDALAGKAPANYIPTQIVDDEDQVSSVKCFGGDGIEIKAPIIDIKLANAEEDVSIVPANAPNIARAVRNPDSTPTASSDNLITSGAVADALSGKANTNHTHSYNENGLYVHLYTKNAGDNPLVAVANTIFNNNGNPYLLHIAVKNNTGNSLAINDMIIGNGTYVIPSETNNSIPDGYIGIIDLYRFTGDSNYYATVSTLFPISA